MVPPAQLPRVVQRLRQVVFAVGDPTGHPRYAELVEAEARLAAVTSPGTPPPATTTSAPAERLLGPDTTKLKVESKVCMNPLPTGVYPLFDPDTDPLLTAVVHNLSYDTKRVCLKAWIEGYSAEAVRTAEIRASKATLPIKFQPVLFPERARLVTEVQRATLHLRVKDLDTEKVECHDTFPLVLLSRNSGLNSARDPATNLQRDLTHYYAAWVTPYAEAVQNLLRVATGHCPDGILCDYQQGGPERVNAQVAALYRVLKEQGLTYVNSVIDYGAAPGTATQRVRLPREALARKSANCIDATVLLASLLEGASFNAALLIVPGHALVGWETGDGTGVWQFLETTMIGTADFEAACQSGQKQYELAKAKYPERVRLHPLGGLRSRGIWPME